MGKDELCNSCADKLDNSWKSQTQRQCHVLSKSQRGSTRGEADGCIYVDMHTQIAPIVEKSSTNCSIGGGGVYVSRHMVHTCPKKIGITVWESSLVFVSKVSEVNSLKNRHKTSILLLEHTLKVIDKNVAFNSGLHPHIRVRDFVDKRQSILTVVKNPFFLQLCDVPDFESESVEYLLPSALPSLKSDSGPLFPVEQVRDER